MAYGQALLAPGNDWRRLRRPLCVLEGLCGGLRTAWRKRLRDCAEGDGAGRFEVWRGETEGGSGDSKPNTLRAQRSDDGGDGDSCELSDGFLDEQKSKKKDKAEGVVPGAGTVCDISLSLGLTYCSGCRGAGEMGTGHCLL